jgi:hypothetical protein
MSMVKPSGNTSLKNEDQLPIGLNRRLLRLMAHRFEGGCASVSEW